MKPTAIVYTSNTGFTEQYANLLSDKTGLPVYALDNAAGSPAPQSAVLYLGWLMAGKVQGYQKAAKRYRIQAVCGVGMGATGSQIADVRRTNKIPDDIPVFTMQGGFDKTKLSGVYKVMMSVMEKTAGKALASKTDRTTEEDSMLELLLHGGSYVSEDNLTAVLDWYAGPSEKE